MRVIEVTYRTLVYNEMTDTQIMEWLRYALTERGELDDDNPRQGCGPEPLNETISFEDVNEETNKTAINTQAKKLAALRRRVYRVMPNAEGEGSQTWQAFAADTDMLRIQAEAECERLSTCGYCNKSATVHACRQCASVPLT